MLRFLGGGKSRQGDALAQALPAELIAGLSRMKWLHVIARGSSFRFDPQDFERFDAIAYALNRLPALYATTEEGWTRQIARANRGLMDLVEMAVDWGINEAHRKRKPFDTPLRPETLEIGRAHV